MKHIKPSPDTCWPRREVKTVACRNKDLVIRITDWMQDKFEPAFDVECYIGGVYDFNESKTFTRWNGDKPRRKPSECKRLAIAYAQEQIAKLL